MLTRIDIENYMNLGTTSFVLDSKNAVVYGENGIGKTNLCRTMSLLKKMLFSELILSLMIWKHWRSDGSFFTSLNLNTPITPV